MPTKEFPAQLDDAGLEWLRYRFTTESGAVTSFMIQYETTIAGERVGVVRYDNSHGYAHRDILNRRGDVIDKQALAAALTPKEALTIGERDIKDNWQRYREDFFEESHD